MYKSQVNHVSSKKAAKLQAQCSLYLTNFKYTVKQIRAAWFKSNVLHRVNVESVNWFVLYMFLSIKAKWQIKA